jgi:hypothetical protein
LPVCVASLRRGPAGYLLLFHPFIYWRTVMLLLIPAILAFMLALLCGGSPRNLAGLRIRNGSLIMLAFLIQLVIYLPALRDSSLVVNLAIPIYLGALLLAVAGMLRNWHLGIPVRLATLGLLLNFTAIALNGGHMPTNAQAMQQVQGTWKIHELQNAHIYANTRLANGNTRVAFLTDIIPVRLPTGVGNVYSIGDVLICTGVASLVFLSMRRAPGAPARRIGGDEGPVVHQPLSA